MLIKITIMVRSEVKQVACSFFLLVFEVVLIDCEDDDQDNY